MEFIIKLNIFILFLISILVTSCENNKPTISKDLYENEYTFVDTENVSVTYLYEGKYILKVQLGIDSVGNELQSMVSTTTGQYEIIKDTLNINFPDFKSQEYKHMKTKYFWVDSIDGRGYDLNFLISPKKIIDSIFGKRIDYYAEVLCVYGKQKALIKNGRLVFLDDNLKERHQ